MPQETQILKPNTVETTNIKEQNLGWLIKYQLLNPLTPELKRPCPMQLLSFLKYLLHSTQSEFWARK